MPTIRFEDKVIEVEENSSIKPACLELGVPFGCQAGICGTCIIDVVEGEENLSDLSVEEEDMGMSEVRRLACQAKIKQGDITIKL